MSQLDDHALTLLRGAVQKAGSNAAVARELGYSRTSISLALKGAYPADAAKLRAQILERYAERVACPHLERTIPPAECRDHRSRTIPIGNPQAIRHWQACQACPHNPNRTRSKGDRHAE